MNVGDSTKNWYSGVPNIDIPGSSFNWIRSGTTLAGDQGDPNDDDMNGAVPWDPKSNFEGILAGTWAPYSMCAAGDQDPNGPAYNKASRTENPLSNLSSIKVVMTSDRSMDTLPGH